MSETAEITRNVDSVEQEIKGIPGSYYKEIKGRIDSLYKTERLELSEEEYKKIRALIANFIYFIHERLELKISRELNYKLIKKWAAKNIKLASYLLQEQFPDFKLEVFYKWVQPEIPVMNMGMYNRSNPDTKDTFH